MMFRRDAPNVGVAHGAWGEDRAVERLRLEGLEIIGRNIRPCTDRRLEIDVIAYDASSDTMVFVEVKQHAHHSPAERRLRSITRDKMRNLRIACNAWRRRNRWQGGYRFDVIEVFGVPGDRLPEIDHIRHVNLFVPGARFVCWD